MINPTISGTLNTVCGWKMPSKCANLNYNFLQQLFSIFNPLPHNHNFQWPCIKSFLKTLREKEKILVTSIFSFSHNVFYCITQREIIILATMNLSSGNAFNLVSSTFCCLVEWWYYSMVKIKFVIMSNFFFSYNILKCIYAMTHNL